MVDFITRLRAAEVKEKGQIRSFQPISDVRKSIRVQQERVIVRRSKKRKPKKKSIKKVLETIDTGLGIQTKELKPITEVKVSKISRVITRAAKRGEKLEQEALKEKQRTTRLKKATKGLVFLTGADIGRTSLSAVRGVKTSLNLVKTKEGRKQIVQSVKKVIKSSPKWQQVGVKTKSFIKKNLSDKQIKKFSKQAAKEIKAKPLTATSKIISTLILSKAASKLASGVVKGLKKPKITNIKIKQTQVSKGVTIGKPKPLFADKTTKITYSEKAAIGPKFKTTIKTDKFGNVKKTQISRNQKIITNLKAGQNKATQQFYEKGKLVDTLKVPVSKEKDKITVFFDHISKTKAKNIIKDTKAATSLKKEAVFGLKGNFVKGKTVKGLIKRTETVKTKTKLLPGEKIVGEIKAGKLKVKGIEVFKGKLAKKLSKKPERLEFVKTQNINGFVFERPPTPLTEFKFKTVIKGKLEVPKLSEKLKKLGVSLKKTLPKGKKAQLKVGVTKTIPETQLPFITQSKLHKTPTELKITDLKLKDSRVLFPIISPTGKIKQVAASVYKIEKVAKFKDKLKKAKPKPSPLEPEIEIITKPKQKIKPKSKSKPKVKPKPTPKVKPLKKVTKKAISKPSKKPPIRLKPISLRLKKPLKIKIPKPVKLKKHLKVKTLLIKKDKKKQTLKFTPTIVRPKKVKKFKKGESLPFFTGAELR